MAASQCFQQQRQQGEQGQKNRDVIAVEACEDLMSVMRTRQVSDSLPTPPSLEDAEWRDFSQIFPQIFISKIVKR